MALVSSNDQHSSSSTTVPAIAQTNTAQHLFSKIPVALLRPILTLGGGMALTQCNRFLATTFKELHYPHYKKLCEELSLPFPTEVKTPLSLVEARKRINSIALMQMRKMRALFSRQELEHATGLRDLACIPLSMRPCLPAERLIGYLAHCQKLERMHLLRTDEISERAPLLLPYDFANNNWKTILLNELQQKEIVISIISLFPRPTPDDISYEMLQGFSKNPSMISNVFRDIIDRLYSITNSVAVFRLFMLNSDNFKVLSVDDLKYAFFSIIIGELDAYETKSSISKLENDIEIIFAQLRMKKANFEVLEIQLRDILKEKAINFQRDYIPECRVQGISPRLHNLRNIIGNNLKDFTFPEEFLKWKKDPVKWKNTQISKTCTIM